MPHDDEHKTKRPLGLSPAQIAGSALSAVSAAFIASWAGTTGTLIGAAVGSIVATTGAAFYTASLRRSSDAVRRAATQVRQTSLRTGTLPRPVVNGPLRSEDHRARPDDPPGTPTTSDDQQTTDEDTDLESADPERRRLSWGRVLLASIAVMVVAVGGITAVEVVTGRPFSSWLGGSDSQGTTVGNVVSSETGSTEDPGTVDPQNTNDGDTTTPSEDAQPSSPADPVPSTEPSEVPPQGPSEPVLPETSTVP